MTLLLEKGADKTKVNKQKQTPADCALTPAIAALLQ